MWTKLNFCFQISSLDFKGIQFQGKDGRNYKINVELGAATKCFGLSRSNFQVPAAEWCSELCIRLLDYLFLYLFIFIYTE